MDPTSYWLLAGIVFIAIIFLASRRVGSGISPAHFQEVKQLLNQREQELREVREQLAACNREIAQLQTQKSELELLQVRFQKEFENIANRVLEEKSLRFSQQNSESLHQLLHPLRQKIFEFEGNIDRKFIEESRERSGLKREIEQLRELNIQLGREAHNLATALKGQSKVQGDWGEFQLETLLEKAGLQKGIHFQTQVTLRDESGMAKRPDFIVQLPDNKHLIIDSKVSLTAFERFYNEQDPILRDRHLRAHLASLRQHVQELSQKKYQNLEGLHTPEFLLLFIPLDSALTAAYEADPDLYTEALNRNIVLVTTATLLATLRTISFIWKQEKQTRSVIEIARQSGFLYDKFVAFVEDLQEIGARLNHAQAGYDAAMNKLVNASRHGDTLVGRAQKIRELGAKASKNLPTNLIEQALENNNEEPAG